METERLILRHYEMEDLTDFFEYISDPEVVRFEPYRPMTMEEAKKTLEYRIPSDEYIAIERKEGHKMIGNVYLGRREFHAFEIGYVMNREFWGKGYAAEACLAVVKAAFSAGTHRIYAECDPENTRSWRLLERMGFAREARLKKNVFLWLDEDDRPIWKDTYIYSLVNELEG